LGTRRKDVPVSYELTEEHESALEGGDGTDGS